ncbi:type II secretion system F family protein [Candidatus Pacearchaeota archaeon]|nr:type II secretion system F family protein [Candidatus Pacearchaeota archaeon]
MKLTNIHWIGITIAAIILILDLIFFFGKHDRNLFLFLIGIGILVAAMPFMLDLIVESRRDEEINEMFLEFSRNLAESVSTGTPVSKSIVNMKAKNYGSLTPYVKKLANQIELGIPMHRALDNFASDVDNVVINRAIALIMEAERAGGEIDYILDSVAKAIFEIEKLKKERRAAIYNLVVQGYIIFFVFIGIMLVMQFKILPLTTGIGGPGLSDLNLNSLTSDNQQISTPQISISDISNQFLYLIIAQGFFAGLIIGKLAEGNIKAGLEHSFILVITAFLVSFGARLLFG